MNIKTIALVVLVFVVIFASSFLYTVKETDRAVLLEFGEVIDPDIKPGLQFKLPWQDVRRFDSRILVLDAPPTEYLTKESKFLIIDSFVMWRVADVQKYFTRTGGSERKANDLLSSRVKNGLKNKVSERTLQEVISGEREALMDELTIQVNEQTTSELGIKIVDIRVKRIDYPQSASESVFNRMRTERQREAQEHRSEGKEESEKIRAEAEKERTVLLAEAYKEAEKTRGDGDASAARTYARAYNRDAEFYSFYRSLIAYRTAFNNKSDVLVLEPDSDFFRFMNKQKGGAR